MLVPLWPGGSQIARERCNCQGNPAYLFALPPHPRRLHKCEANESLLRGIVERGQNQGVSRSHALDSSLLNRHVADEH